MPNGFFHPHEVEKFLRELDHNYNKKLDTIIKRIKYMSQEVDKLVADQVAAKAAVEAAEKAKQHKHTPSVEVVSDKPVN